MEGKIIKNISNDYTVYASNTTYVCKGRGKFRNLGITPLVGDEVVFDPDNHYILEIKKRKNELVRPPVCNIDQTFIIASVKNPDFSPNLLDKLLDVIEFHNIQPIICLTKLDLLTKEELEEIKKYKAYYQNIGYLVFENTEIEAIKKTFRKKVSVFTGQSGAGKSTLLNKINPHLQIKTDEISYALGRGKHTTRHVELLSLEDGWVADTPGFSSLEFIGMTKEDIRDNFIEFNEYKDFCEYRDCMHENETNCEVKRKVEQGKILPTRYQNYLKFIQNQKR